MLYYIHFIIVSSNYIFYINYKKIFYDEIRSGLWKNILNVEENRMNVKYINNIYNYLCKNFIFIYICSGSHKKKMIRFKIIPLMFNYFTLVS